MTPYTHFSILYSEVLYKARTTIRREEQSFPSTQPYSGRTWIHTPSPEQVAYAHTDLQKYPSDIFIL